MQQSGENYLEMIYLLSCQKTRVRAIDVAKALGFSKPSVSRAVGRLKQEGLLENSGSLDLVLSKDGLKKAKMLVERGQTIAQFLMMTTDVDLETARADAGQIAHFISSKTFEGIRKFIKEVEAMNE